MKGNVYQLHAYKTRTKKDMEMQCWKMECTWARWAQQSRKLSSYFKAMRCSSSARLYSPSDESVRPYNNKKTLFDSKTREPLEPNIYIFLFCIYEFISKIILVTAWKLTKLNSRCTIACFWRTKIYDDLVATTNTLFTLLSSLLFITGSSRRTPWFCYCNEYLVHSFILFTCIGMSCWASSLAYPTWLRLKRFAAAAAVILRLIKFHSSNLNILSYT